MARPRKTGLDYYPFDVNFFSDKKIKVLKSRFGADGIIIYIYLLCEVYRNGYCIKIDDDYEYVISDDLGMSIEKVKQVMKFLLERSLLDSTLFQSDTIITSRGIQSRFQEAVKTRGMKSEIEVEEKYWLLSEQETQSFIKYTQNPSYSEKNPSYSEKNPSYSEKNTIKESKVNKRKVKESKEEKRIYFPHDAELDEAFSDYVSMRKQIRKPMTEKAIWLAVKKLQDLAALPFGDGMDSELAIQILNQSVLNSWQGLFPLKEDKRKQTSNRQDYIERWRDA